ncbi:Spy/CpxP family protein refolding chaperone [Flagellimonas sp.]|uniref:Spy/CpxP family protein refolding chaperone n=1 Tax=Flagellimonas sp. TaxID=2058762 RepID=UPI003B59F966
MNRNHQILFNAFLFALVGIVGYGQEKSKTYTETFNVSDETVLNINTSHADIEFETWNKNQVEITAVIELEGATDEEAKSFFEKDAIKILGNSKEIEVSTKNTGFGASNNFSFVLPDLPTVAPIIEHMELPEMPEVFVMPEMPPMPPIPHIDFDYDAYKKDGDKYLKKWKKDFDKNFDEKYQNRFEEWSDKMEKMAEQREKQREEREVQRQKLMEQREAMREEARAKRDEMRAKRDELREERNELRHKLRSERVFSIQSGDDSNIFYFSTDGEHKKYKVKKRIKIKMPKSVKLKMNVRHGEVKLAANAKNINASLSYASLFASTIDGDRTDIRASYSPIVVQKWKYGQLKTDYSDNVSLAEVVDLRLNAVSSNVSIDRLTNNVFVTNSLGALEINSVSDGFSNIDITVENGEVNCKIPTVPFSIYVNETFSEFEYPEVLAIGTSKNYNTNIHKGYHVNNREGKVININSKYSEVVLTQ